MARRFDVRVIAHALWLTGTIVGVLYLLRDRPSELWILNPDATPLPVVFAQTSTVVPPGRVARLPLPPEPNQRVVLTRAGQAIEHVIGLAPMAREVVLIDVAADAAYVAVDASDLYQAQALPGRPPPLTIMQLDPPGREHRFLRARDGTLGPGEPLPDALTAHGGPRARSSVYKIYRVRPDDVAQPDAWVEKIRVGILTGSATVSPEWLGDASR